MERDTATGMAAGEGAARTLCDAAEVLRAVARAATDWPAAPGAAAQADALRERATRLAQENATAYAHAAQAIGEPGEHHPVALANALTQAGAVPGRIAAAGADVAELALMIVMEGPADRRPDAAACAMLADGATAAAALLVAVNLAVIGTDQRRVDADAAAERSRAASVAALGALASDLS